VATAAQVAAFSGYNQDLVLLAKRDLAEFWRSLNVAGNPIVVRDAMLAFFPELVQGYGDAAAFLAADFYDELRGLSPSPTRFRAIVSTPPLDVQTEASARWGLGPLFDPEPNPDQALLNLSGSLQRLVLQPGRSTIIESANRDPARWGFARIAIGATCKWCLMLAGRGFVYGSEEAAGQFDNWHDDCNCAVVPAQSQYDIPALEVA
jgi:hypothetical protein